MSIAESLRNWLAEYDGIQVGDVIENDRLAAEPDALGLFRAPNNAVQAFVDGSSDVTAYYLFVIRRESQTDAMRLDNEAWLDGLASWIGAKNRAMQFPILSGKRTCCGVTVSGTYVLSDATDADETWQLTLAINYHEEA